MPKPAAEATAVFTKPARIALVSADFKRVAVLDTGLGKKLGHGAPAFTEAAVPA